MKTCTFNGRRYHITVDYLDGMCDTYKKERELVILRNLNTRCGLETACHEALHACGWSKSEEVVNRTAKDLSRFLWGLGYKKA